MNLGFKDRFVPMVEDGSKPHSIRGGDRWRVGMRADLYARPRQKGMRLLFRAPVVRVETIEIRALYVKLAYVFTSLQIRIEGVELSNDEALAFAWRDGFREPCDGRYTPDSLQQMYAFWRAEHGPEIDTKVFRGQVIHWDYDERFTDIGETCYRETIRRAQEWRQSFEAAGRP